jgi:hypothetical protein
MTEQNVDSTMTRINRMIGKRLWLTLLLASVALSMSAVADVVCDNENAFIPESTPTGDFVLHEDGTVTHNATGLTWMRCGFGQIWDSGSEACVDDPETPATYTWQEALNAVAELNNNGGFASHTDWRLPNKNELATIVEARCWLPAINAAVFPSTEPVSWWSSSPRAASAAEAWRVHFDNGRVDGSPKSGGGSVRAVRAGH